MEGKHPVKILLVDDKKENLLSLQVILDGQGYNFVEATSGKEALRYLLKNQDFAIILMDVQMPIMDGFETAQIIRESDKLKHVPIIFLTANMNTSEYIFKGYQAGAVDYMIKPLMAEILQAKVRVYAELYRKNHELVRNEEQMKKLNIEILAANQILEKQSNELKIANRELEAFTYVSSHDLQEPLRKIQTFTAIILENEDKNLSDQGKHNFQRVRHAAERMRQLIESLLAFSHTTTADRKFEKTDLNTILDDVKSELKETIDDKNVIIEAGKLGQINIIPFQFTQLVQNLISNALKFSKPDVPLQIIIKTEIRNGAAFNLDRLDPDKNYCHISFSDNGIGFAPHFNERIFEVFQRLHNKDAYAGTGIGLSIVKKIVENHNGFITAKSQPMEGATFDIYIPT